ncbi:hypothetical protein KNJ79_05145 [Sphingopyxis indica]|uniref:hypothetical protein n=1 Tax=Sphingopyxis indica TaxID=436663 RepID=UPI0029391074|nr:hypothetical protein [Sphingopyxis indica]WOF44318.1 hypothetical protein KNJ79_05145 [Sphingopyxis indica]
MIDATVTHTLTASMLADLMVTAIEGGCGYWASDLELVSGTDEYEPPYYADARFYLSPFKLALTDCMRDVHTIESDTLEKGWRLLNELYPRRALAVVEETYDAEDADVFLQLAVFGEIVFG